MMRWQPYASCSYLGTVQDWRIGGQLGDPPDGQENVGYVGYVGWKSLGPVSTGTRTAGFELVRRVL